MKVPLSWLKDYVKIILPVEDLARWLVLAGLVSAALVFGFRQHPSAFDDAYITYRYARNIALGRGFVYNIGEPVLGTTTPLYTFLLAGLSFIWLDLPSLSHSIGVLAWALCVPVIYGIGRAGGRAAVGLAAAALAALNALFLSVLGMETTLYVLLALLTFYLQLRERPVSAAVCAGLTFLTRWDGILVVSAFLFAEALKRRGGVFKPGLVCLSIIVPWLIYSVASFGSIFPNSYFAKAGQGWNQALGGAEIGPFGSGLLLTAASAQADNQLFVLLLILAVLGLWSVLRKGVRWWPLLLWTVTYIGGYIVLGVLRFPWYYPPLVPAFALLAAQGIDMVAATVSLRLHWSAGRVVFAGALAALCLLPNLDWLMSSQKIDVDAHSATYVEVGQWLQAHTPADSTVALLEIGIVGFYSDRTVIDTMGLVSPGMLGHLEGWLQTLQYAVNRCWPDYVVALKRTAWEGVVREPWFEEAYALETQIENDADPVAPVSIYRRRDGFPPTAYALDSTQDVQFDGAFTLHRVRLVEDRFEPGGWLHVQPTWEAHADINADYRVQFDLLEVSSGQRWTLASGLQPMRGGNPTTQWRSGDRIDDAYTLPISADLPAGSYLIQISLARRDGPVIMFDARGEPIGYVVAGPIQAGEHAAEVRSPGYSVRVTFADSISLAGYDLLFSGAGNDVAMTLYWQATGDVLADYTVFVHLLSPEGDLVAQHDSPPLLPTSLWVPGARVVDSHTLALPAALSPGDYQIRVGLYRWPDLKRLAVVASGCLDATNDALLAGYLSFGGSHTRSERACPEAHRIAR